MKNRAVKAFMFLPVVLWLTPAALASQTQPKSVAEQVAAAIADARQGNTTLVYALNAKQAFPYLKKYATDPNGNVQRAVITAAAAAHTGEAVQVLTSMVANHPKGKDAIDALYDNFDKSFLRQNGGEELKSSLLLCLKRGQLAAGGKTILLLTCFPKDADVLQALTVLRHNFISQSLKEPSSASSYSAQVLPVDLALSELGQTDASVRVQAAVKRSDVGMLPALLMSLKFVDNPTTLKSLVPLLQDRRYTKVGIVTNVDPLVLFVPPGEEREAYLRAHPQPPPQPPRTQFFRVCDLALLRLAQKTGIDIGVPAVVSAVRDHNANIEPQNYTDAELDIAYERLNNYFNVKK